MVLLIFVVPTIELTGAADGRAGGSGRGIKVVAEEDCQWRQRPR